MGKEKRIKKGVESLKKQIEIHFNKLEKDLEEKNFEYARYHIKELDKSLISSLKRLLDILGEEDKIIKKYRERLSVLVEEIDK